MKRTIAMVSAALLLLTSLVGCGSEYDNPEQYVTLPDLSTITISQADIDADFAEEKETIMEENRKPDYKKIEGAAVKGDQVNIDYEGKPTDKSLKLSESTIAGMKAEGYDLVLGSDSFIGAYTKDGKETHKGFEEQLIGKKAGDKVDVKVKFPDNYDTAELKGVEVVFTVTVNSVSRLTVDEDTLIKVDYNFTLKEEEPSTEAPKTDAPVTGGSTSTPSAGENEEGTGTTDAPTTGDTATNEPSTDAPATEEPKTEEPETEGTTGPSLGGNEDDEDEPAKFTDLFKKGSFQIDYTKEADDTKFNTIFKIADFRGDFTGKNLYYELTKDVVIPSDVDTKFKDYAGKTVTITFTVSSATILPEWNDELIKEITSEAYTTVKAYEELMVKNITIELALKAVEEAAEYTGYPEDEANKLYEEYVDQQINQALYSAIGKYLDEATASELESAIDQATYDKIYASAATQAIASVKSRILIEYLCNKLEISEVTDEEYDKALQEAYDAYAADYNTMYYYYYYYGVTFASADDMEEYLGKDSFELQIRTDKMSEKLIEVIKITK